jgi:hypothetical protein
MVSTVATHLTQSWCIQDTYPDDDMAALPFAFLDRAGAAAEELSGSTLARLARPLRGAAVSPASVGCAGGVSRELFLRLREAAGVEWGGGGGGARGFWFGGFSLEEPVGGLADERVTLDDMRI